MPTDEPRHWIKERTGLLERSTNPEELELAAIELASSDNPDALDALGAFLRRGEFLGRLDELTKPGEKTAHLRRVFAPLIERPSPEVARLCLTLVDDPAFVTDDDRKSFLLETLACVRPMSAAAADYFRRTNEEGYFGYNARLLAANGSPRALQLLASMMTDNDVPSDDRIECLHMSIVPHRTRLGVLEMAAALMAKDLEEPVATAVIESVFDYQVEWFTPHGPVPPGWRTAPDDVLSFLIDLGVRAKRRPILSDRLQQAIDATIDTARALLARRQT